MPIPQISATPISRDMIGCKITPADFGEIELLFGAVLGRLTPNFAGCCLKALWTEFLFPKSHR